MSRINAEESNGRIYLLNQRRFDRRQDALQMLWPDGRRAYPANDIIVHKPIDNRFVPALSFKWLTRLYDPMLRLTMREATWRPRFVGQISPAAGERILDLGCGTGSLLIMLKRQCSAASIEGVDSDQEILALAHDKIAKERLNIRLYQGYINVLPERRPFADGSFHKVVTSLVFHHLTEIDKLHTLRRVFRLLKRCGQFHLLDWGRPAHAAAYLGFLGVRALDGWHNTSSNAHGELPAMLSNAGFIQIEETFSCNTIFGTLRAYRAAKGPVTLSRSTRAATNSPGIA